MVSVVKRISLHTILGYVLHPKENRRSRGARAGHGSESFVNKNCVRYSIEWCVVVTVGNQSNTMNHTNHRGLRIDMGSSRTRSEFGYCPRLESTVCDHASILSTFSLVLCHHHVPIPISHFHKLFGYNSPYGIAMDCHGGSRSECLEFLHLYYPNGCFSRPTRTGQSLQQQQQSYY